jgi:hypothetical protein
MGEAFWCRHLVAALGVLEVLSLTARARERNADRGSVVEAIATRDLVKAGIMQVVEGDVY